MLVVGANGGNRCPKLWLIPVKATVLDVAETAALAGSEAFARIVALELADVRAGN